MSDHSTDIRKPSKPSADFPLFAHASGRWAKKIRGKFVYFGKWSEPDAALAKYLAQADDLHAGRTPDSEPAGVTIEKLCGRFLTTKKRLRDAGELSPHSFDAYLLTCKKLQKIFGKRRLVVDLRPADFERLRVDMGKTWGPVRIGNEINRTRTVFNYAYKNALIEKPVIYGEGFNRPSAKVLRQHRQKQGPKFFEREEILRMLAAATQPLKTMILLAANGGFSNSDLGTMPLSALDLTNGWIDFPRAKTAVPRRVPLWPETIASLKDWLTLRPPTANDPKYAQLVFLTRIGGSWHKDVADGPITKETRKLLDSLEIKGKRNFYALRHVFQTIGEETSRDFVAVRRIMGHVSGDIADHYRERVSDARLQAVTDAVRSWLFG